MFEDSRLRIFLTVVEEGNFSAAARKLGITQPAVSQNIAELEKQLGVQLLQRSRTEAGLTPEGEQFLGYAKQISHWYKVAYDAFHPDPLAIHPQGLKPARLTLGNGKEALVWASGNDIHLELPE
ncbi:MAG: LysR family transcriptional regulator [Bacteroidales bacterium]|nr:LysR family transcriptional regulator [Bacteroidales bacterium]